MYTCIGAFFVPNDSLIEWSEPAKKGNWDAFRRGLLSVARCSTFLRGDDARAFEALSRWLTRSHAAPLPRGAFVEEFLTTTSMRKGDDFLLFSCVGNSEAEDYTQKMESIHISDCDLKRIGQSVENPIACVSMYRALSFLKTFLQFGRYRNDHHALLIFD